MFDREKFYRQVVELSADEANRSDRPATFHFQGRDWDLLSGVFPTLYRPSTYVSLEFLGLDEADSVGWSSMLEIGSGAGVVAVTAALAGCPRVLATDINPNAVENTARNASRHGVSSVLETAHSDLFDRVDSKQKFDLIFWNSNFIWAPPEHQITQAYEHSYFDPGYQAHRRFLRESPGWTTPSGRVLLLLSTNKADTATLFDLATDLNRELTVVKRKTFQDGSDATHSEYLLVEVSERQPR
ncbi:hypothetical protein FDG2_3251 [Candidatus Protofrankia californiensis]|uniref:Methyltransferase small n=1 Tax=Candidatus Protofrankia californiensis TaxID=1839754 RepID=A0A1C3NZC9_9ACTN|nr:hypothetical protein FDG2_3251 [Candidatus Protofrankia californiensis]